jgi:hypothetical protein
VVVIINSVVGSPVVLPEVPGDGGDGYVFDKLWPRCSAAGQNRVGVLARDYSLY